jgi:hypothetical protein
MKQGAILLLTLAGAAVGVGQTTAAPSGRKPEVYTRETGVQRALMDLNYDPSLSLSAVPGHPFSAQVVTTIKRIAEDGVPQTATVRDLVARDTRGSWYRESRISGVTGWLSPYGVSAQVWNPEQQTLMELMMTSKTAVLYREEPPYIPADKPGARPQPAVLKEQYGGNASTVREDLGDRKIDGVDVWGTRVTETFAAEVMGTEKPLTKVIEIWYSQELAMDMEIHVVNPVKGEKTIRIEQLDRHEPDQSLFQLPPGFTERFEQKR